MPKSLTSDAIDRLRRNGFHFPIPGVSEEDAVDYRRQLETFEAENGGALKGAHRFKTPVGIFNRCVLHYIRYQ